VVYNIRRFAKGNRNLAQGEDRSWSMCRWFPRRPGARRGCRAEVIRPLVESAHRSRHLVQAAAATLGLSERQTLYRHMNPTGQLRPDGEKLLGRKRKGPQSAGRAQSPA